MTSNTPKFAEGVPFPQPVQANPPAGGDGTESIVVRPKDLIAFLRRWVLLIGAVAAIIVAFAVVSLVRTTPTYVASAQMLLGDQGLGDRNSFDLVEAQAISTSVIEGELAILRSTNLLLRVVKRLELEKSPEFNPSLLPPPARTPIVDDVKDGVDAVTTWAKTLLLGPEPSAEVTDASGELSGAVDAASNANEEVLGEYRTPVERLRRAVSVRQQGSSFVVTVTARSEDRRMAAAIANSVMEEYIAFLTDKRFAAAQRFTNWLESRVTDLALKWEESANDVLAYQTRIEGEADSSVRLDQQMTEMTSKLVDARASLAELEAQLETLDAAVARNGVLAAADLLSTDAIQTFRQDLLELQRDEMQLVRNFGEDSTQVQAMQRAVERTMENIESEVVRARAQLSSSAAQQRINVTALRGSLRDLESLPLAGSKEQLRLDQLMRVSDANRRVYEEFLGRFKETSEIKNLQRSDAEIITFASPPGTPDTPRKKVTLVLAGAGGLFAGIGVAMLLELRRRAIGNNTALARQTGMTVLAHLPTLPHSISAQRLAQRLNSRPDSKMAAAARDLRRNISLVADQPARAIVIASNANDGSAPGIAMLLAWSYAQSGKRCLLVDTDIRTASLSSRFDVPEDVSFVSALYGERAVSDCIIDKTPLGVPFLPAARSSADPEMIFSTQRSGAICNELIERYDVVVFLAPALSGASDVFAPPIVLDIALLNIDCKTMDDAWLS